MAKYELTLTSGNVFSTPVTLTVTPAEGPSVTISGSNAISTPVELAVLNSIGPRGETGPQGPQGPQGQKGDPGETVSLQIYDGNINFGQSVQTTDNVTFNTVTTTGDITVGGTITGTVNGPFVGDVTVESGDTLTIDAGGGLSVPDDIISGDKVEGGTIDAITINTLTATTINVSGNVDGRDLSADGTKLDGIEAGATADQTDAEIKTAYENNADTNAFTDADHSKLDGIEANATADQTDAEIKTAYENNANTNAFTDADHSKLDGIEAGATADQTDAEIKTAYENNANTNAFTDADHSKLDGIEANADVTDTANVTAAGALMDSEVTNLAAVKALDQGVATTDDVTFNDLTLTGQLKGPATFTIDPAAHGDDTGTVVVAGNLQVDGTTTTINSTIVEIDDLNLKLAAEATTNAQANGAGITVGDGLANITYNSGTDRWVLDKELSADVVGTVSGDVTGNVTGNLTGNVTGTVSTLTNHDTDDLTEGTNNLYYTDSRSRAAISVTDAGGDGSLAYDNTTGIITFTGPSAAEVRAHLSAGGDLSYDSNTGIISFTERTDAEVRQLLSVSGDLSYNSTTGVFSFTERTDAEVRGLVSATDAGGDGSFSYDSGTGVFTYTGPSAAEVRAHLSAGGDLSYNSTTGVISFTERTDAEVRQLFSVSGDLSYDNTTGIFSFTERTDAEVRGLFSVAGDLSYNSTTGEFSFTERTDAEVRGLVSASGDLSYNNTTGVFSFTERTDAEVRGLVSASDAGGDGSFSYDSATGVFTYTGPSASEVRSHFTDGTGVTITNGQIAIGQAVGTTDNVNFGNATLSGYLAGPATFTIDPAAVGNNTGKVVIAGDLQVDGTTTTVNSTTVEVADKNVVLGANATADTENHGAGITVSRPDSTDATISWDETNDEWDVTNGLSVAGDIAVSGTVDGRDVAADGTKLDGIESGATADQTGTEIKSLYEAEVNAFTDAQFTKLAGIETGATADQTGAEIKAAYEAEANTNAYTDAEKTKLAGVESGATADQTGAEIKALYEAEANAFTDAQFTKLAGIETGATADQTGSEIKTALFAEADTNNLTDTLLNKLNGIEDNADVTDTANVTAAGALMDSEVLNLQQVKEFDSADYATAAQGALADTAVQPNDSPTFGTLNATTVDFGDWTITESGGSLYFATGGTNKMKLDALGNLQVVGNVESNATIS